LRYSSTKPTRRKPTNQIRPAGGNIAKSSGAFFFVWALIALGVTALFSVILSGRGLWTLLWGQR